MSDKCHLRHCSALQWVPQHMPRVQLQMQCSALPAGHNTLCHRTQATQATQGDSCVEKHLLMPSSSSPLRRASLIQPPALPHFYGAEQQSFGYLSHVQRTRGLLKPSSVCLKLSRCKCRKDAAITPQRAVKRPVLKSVFLSVKHTLQFLWTSCLRDTQIALLKANWF